MKFLNFNSITTKIIILLIGTSSVFIYMTFTMAKDIFSQGFTSVIKEKINITKESIAPQIALNLSYGFHQSIIEIGENLLRNPDIIYLKVESKKLDKALVFKSVTYNNPTPFLSSTKLLDPSTRKDIGVITLMYSSKSYDKYMNSFYTWVLWGVFGFVLCVIFILIFLIRALKPLSTLAKNLQEFNPYNPKPIIYKEYSKDEIGSIAHSANIMVNNLIEYIKQSSELTQKLSLKEVHLKDAQRIANVGSWEYNIIDDSLHLSDEIYRILGINLNKKISWDTLRNFIAKEDRQRVNTVFNNAIEKGSKFDIKYKLRLSNSKSIHIWTKGKVRKKIGGSIKLTAVSMNISKEIKSKEIIEKLAYHDSLTGLANRTLLKDRVQNTILKAKRDKSNFAILFLDLDHFKLINDTLGHSIGDKLLLHVSKQLKKTIRESDTVARIGGDEFVILLSEISSYEDANHIASKIITSLNQVHTVESNQLHITTSIGISLYPESGSTLDELLTKADTAMYEAKKDGRNNYKVYTKKMSSHMNRIIQIEQDLRNSINNPQEFEIYYQAKINSKNGFISGAEALIRWRHPTKGLIFPDDFINIAESSGIIIDIGNIVIENSIKDLYEFNKLGLGGFKIAINLSTKQFGDTNLVSLISNMIQKYDINPVQLEFEITESLSMQDTNETLKILNELKELGVSIAIDDFGTGYSSLAYLKQFPINTLKIDKSFVMDMIIDKDDKTIVKTIINMAHSLEFKTVAEGVESIEHVKLLSQMGCDELQGFHYSKAIPKEDFIKFLKDYNPN